MSALLSKTNLQIWWNQFPSGLRLITKARLLASLGAGGVIYLTPLVFNKLNFSAAQIGSGFTVAALVGTISRLLTGRWLDNGASTSMPLKCAVLITLLSDIILFNSNNYTNYLFGQVFIGIAAGIYWPTVELAVPKSCEKIPSGEAFALVRSADAAGTSLGVLLGALAAYINNIRMIYVIDAFCMLYLFTILLSNADLRRTLSRSKDSIISNINSSKDQRIWLRNIFPILSISLMATSIFSLLQSALPVDLVKGGIVRPPLSESWSGIIIFIQLFLILIFQWPIGRWLSTKSPRYGLNLSILCLSLSCLFIGISGIWEEGIWLILAAQFPMSIGLASFLPTATNLIIQIAPSGRKGIALAAYSQCFAISALIAPLYGGLMIDYQGNALAMWVLMCILCLCLKPVIATINLSSNNIN